MCMLVQGSKQEINNTCSVDLSENSMLSDIYKYIEFNWVNINFGT